MVTNSLKKESKMSKSKYHTEAMIKVEGREVPRRKVYNRGTKKEDATGPVILFVSRNYRINDDGSLNNCLPNLTKAEKKAKKREKVKAMKEIADV
jgi:hypothetical protein